MILTVGGIKGGSGKTTIATNLAIMAAAAGADVLLVDADDQQTAADFTAVRKEDHPDAAHYTCTQLTGKAVRTEIADLAKRYHHVIIDTGGRDTASQRAALSISTVLLVPFVPRSFDVWTITKVAALVEEMRTVNPALVAYVFLNRCDPEGQGSENEDAAQMLKEIPALEYLDAPVRARKAFAHAASHGLSVTELTGASANAKASTEIMTLYRHCFDAEVTLNQARA